MRLAIVSALTTAVPAVAQQRMPGTGSAPPPIALTGATVIDVQDGRRLPGQTVLIVGTRIQAIGPVEEMRLPATTQMIDARGKYLIPGLWNMHVHLFGGPESMYRSMIATGVTGMREAGSEIPLDTLARFKREIAAGTRVGPRQIVSARSIDECDRPPDFGEYHICTPTPAAARRLVDSFARAGADMIKTYSMSIAMYFAIAAEARRLGIPFGGHLPLKNRLNGDPVRGLDGLEASDSGALILDHELWLKNSKGTDCTRTHPESACTYPAAAQRFRRNGTWVTDLLLGFRSALFADSTAERLYAYGWRPLTQPEREHRLMVHEALVAANVVDPATGLWTGAECGELRAKYAANMPVLASTDITHPGVGLHAYLAMYVACGAPPLWALQTATLNPARALRATDSLGTLAAGKLADLVVLDADPLTAIWNVTKIHAVIANGRYFDRAALDRLLVDAQAARAGEPPSWIKPPAWMKKQATAVRPEGAVKPAVLPTKEP